MYLPTSKYLKSQFYLQLWKTEILKAPSHYLNQCWLIISEFHFYSFNIVTQGSQHSSNTRQSEQIRTERTRAEYCDNRLRIFLPYLINTVPLHLLEKISTHSIQRFSSGIKSTSSTCIQLSAPLPTAIFVTAINNNEMYISNVQWRGGGHSRWPARRRLGRLRLLLWLPALHDSLRQWLGRTFDSLR